MARVMKIVGMFICMGLLVSIMYTFPPPNDWVNGIQPEWWADKYPRDLVCLGYLLAIFGALISFGILYESLGETQKL